MSENFKLNPRTQELIEKFSKRGVTPEDTLIDMLAGETGELHPVLFAISVIARKREAALPTNKQWEGLVKLAKRYEDEWEEGLDPPLVANIAKELMPYIYPKLSSASLDANVEAKVTIIPAISLKLGLRSDVEQIIKPYDGSLDLPDGQEAANQWTMKRLSYTA